MDGISVRSIAAVAVIQAAIALAALLCFPAAAFAVFSIGLLALGRYAALALFASTIKPNSHPWARFLATSAWALGFIALLVALLAVAVKAKALLPWAVAAAFAGPASLTVLALGSGLGALAADRARTKIENAGGAR